MIMSVIVDLILIQTIICFIIDCSGFIQSLEKGLSRLFKFKVTIPRPFSCSLCTGWWSNLLYLIIIGEFSLPYVAVTAGLALISRNISGFLIFIREFLIWIDNLLYKIIR